MPLLSHTAAITHGIPLWEQLLILAGMFAVLLLFGLRVAPYALDWLARHNNREAFLLVVLLAVFLAAWAMHQSGLSMAPGSFIILKSSVDRFERYVGNWFADENAPCSDSLAG